MKAASCDFLSPLVVQISPKTPPHWIEDQKNLLQILCQKVEALTVRIWSLMIRDKL